MAGAAIGSAIGSAVGGIASAGIQAGAQTKAARTAAQAQIDAIRMAINEQRGAYEDVYGLWDPIYQQGASGLSQLAEGIQSGAFTEEIVPFEYGATAMDFIDPSVNYQAQQAQRGLESSAALAGALESGATMKALQEEQQRFAQTDYGNAYQRMMADKEFAYNQYINDFNARRQAAQDKYAGLANLSNLALQGASALTGARTGTATNVGGLSTQIGNAQSASQMVQGQGLANVGAQVGSGVGQIGGAIADYASQQRAQTQAPQVSSGLNSLAFSEYNPSLANQMGQGNI